MILDYRLLPMQQIQLDELVVQLRIGRTPVREALYRLRGEGLISSAPNSGFFVPKLTEKGIHDLYAFRLNIEAAVAYQAARNCDTDKAKELRDKWSERTADPARLPIHDRVMHNERFYEALAGVAANSFLSDSIGDLNGRLRFFRTILLSDAEEFRTSCTMQMQLLSALSNGRAAMCSRIARRHVEYRIAQVPDLAQKAVAAIYLKLEQTAKNY